MIMAQFTASLNLSALFQGIILNFRLLVGELLDAARVLLTLVCCGASGGRKWRERSLRTTQARSSSRAAKIPQVPLSFLCLFVRGSMRNLSAYLCILVFLESGSSKGKTLSPRSKVGGSSGDRRSTSKRKTGAKRTQPSFRTKYVFITVFIFQL